uniref:Formyl-CoA transferase n=1 Tax=Alexandrium monilatum TaxID=311494 RepID=A0A7S4R9J2_9DINO
MKFITPDDEPGTPAPRFPGGVGDSTTSVHLMAGVLGALYDRERTGQGQFVEACIYRAGLWSMGIPATNALCVKTATNGQGRFDGDPQTAFDTPTYNAYACKDGAWIQLLGLEMERHLDKMLEAIDPEGHIRSSEPFRGDAKAVTERVKPNDELRILLIKKMGECFLKRTAAEWAAIFKEKDVWFHAVSDINDVLDDPQYNAIGAFSEVGGPHRLVSHPIKFSAAPPFPRGRAPLLGADSEKVVQDVKAGRW